MIPRQHLAPARQRIAHAAFALLAGGEDPTLRALHDAGFTPRELLEHADAGIADGRKLWDEHRQGRAA